MVEFRGCIVYRTLMVGTWSYIRLPLGFVFVPTLGALVACGYRTVASPTPSGIERIALAPFDEDTPLGLSPELTREFSQLLASDGIVLAAREDADAILTGRIVSSRTGTSPASGDDARVPAYEIEAKLEARLVGRSGETLWQATIDLREDFLAGAVGGPSAGLFTETQRRRAVFRMAQRAAQELHTQLQLAKLEKRAG